MVNTDIATFLWQLQTFRKNYDDDFRKQELDMKTLKEKYVHPRLHHAYNALMRNTGQLFICLDFIQIIQRNHPDLRNPIINTGLMVNSVWLE